MTSKILLQQSADFTFKCGALLRHIMVVSVIHDWLTNHRGSLFRLIMCWTRATVRSQSNGIKRLSRKLITYKLLITSNSIIRFSIHGYVPCAIYKILKEPIFFISLFAPIALLPGSLCVILNFPETWISQKSVVCIFNIVADWFFVLRSG